MPLFSTIGKAEDLPPVGTTYEKDHLDFKVRASKVGYELAKDVASLANRIGGVILVGAKDENDRLAMYVPMALPDAEDCRRAFNDAVRDRCFPSPRIDVAIISRESGHVVAVNAWPFPDQPVGVKVPVKKEPGEKIDDNAYLFPIRTNTGTEFLKPQELATIMIPQIRKAAIDLSRIVDGGGVAFLSWLVPGSDRPGNKPVDIKGIDPHHGFATLMVPTGSGEIQMELPLQSIEAVQHLPDGHWLVSLRGTLSLVGNGWRWVPPRSE